MFGKKTEHVTVTEVREFHAAHFQPGTDRTGRFYSMGFSTMRATFKRDDGTIFTLKVPEDVADILKEGMHGMVTHRNKKLIRFAGI